MLVTLPCGIVEDGKHVREVELEEMTGYEEDLLADPSKVGKTVSPIGEVLARCTARIGEFQAPDKRTERVRSNLPKLNKLLLNDRTFLLIRLRQLSLGDDFRFEGSCPACKTLLPGLRVNLSELKVNEMREVVESEEEEPKPRPPKEQNEFQTPSGRVIVWRHLTGDDEFFLASARKDKPGDTLSAMLYRRVLAMATKPGEAPAKPSGIGAIKALPTKDRNAFRDEVERMEGGIETEIEMNCDNCAHSWMLTLPTTQTSFFFPAGIR
jgi:hypothetical protein